MKNRLIMYFIAVWRRYVAPIIVNRISKLTLGKLLRKTNFPYFSDFFLLGRLNNHLINQKIWIVRNIDFGTRKKHTVFCKTLYMYIHISISSQPFGGYSTSCSSLIFIFINNVFFPVMPSFSASFFFYSAFFVTVFLYHRQCCWH